MTTTLAQMYSEHVIGSGELLGEYVGAADFNKPLQMRRMSYTELASKPVKDGKTLAELYKSATSPQRQLVKKYAKTINQMIFPDNTLVFTKILCLTDSTEPWRLF